MNKKVSCICPTYNRIATNPKLLNETVQSFLLQNYDNKELIILNDNPLQTIIFDHPQVIVVNHNSRFPTLGDKYNYAINEISTGDYICCWEDDDISLPHRLLYSVKYIQNYSYFNPLGYWYTDNEKIYYDHPIGYTHNASIYTREAFNKVNGYQSISGPQDADMDNKLRLLKDTSPITLKDRRKDWFFIYRWNISNLHLSGFIDTQKVYDEYEETATKSMEYVIEPEWYSDYIQMTSI